LIGSLIWYGFSLAEGSGVPPSSGVWDICYVAARLLLIGAVLAAIRSLMSLRLAALDACVIVASGVAFGAAFIGRGLEDNVTVRTLVTLNRPVLGIVTLILIASAALGSWEGMPRSIALLGLGEVALTIGSLIYGYSAVQGDFVDDRWADLAWSAGAAISMLAGSVLILDIDRPVLVRSRVVSRDGSGFNAVLHRSLGATTLTLGVAAYGFVTAREPVAIIGVAASAAMRSRRPFAHRMRSAPQSARRSCSTTPSSSRSARAKRLTSRISACSGRTRNCEHCRSLWPKAST
jgi:hypothetical protein